MKKLFFLLLCFSCLQVNSQSVFGYWYGHGSVKSTGPTNNYLIELILQPEKGKVQGIMNYYFKDSYRSLKISGKYNAATRELILNDIPVTYFESPQDMEVDCMMDFVAKLRVSKADSVILGSFISKPEYKYVCPEVNFSLAFQADISKKDSIIQSFKEYKEQYQVWKPSVTDTIPPIIVEQKKIENHPLTKEYETREVIYSSDLTVENKNISVEFYDNGEVDGDTISVFFNRDLIAYNQRLSERAVRIDLELDDKYEVNEIGMLAQNLGSIPPNTALMIVYDGEKRHLIRLSSDLKKTAVLRIHRKK